VVRQFLSLVQQQQERVRKEKDAGFWLVCVRGCCGGAEMKDQCAAGLRRVFVVASQDDQDSSFRPKRPEDSLDLYLLAGQRQPVNVNANFSVNVSKTDKQ